jgi:dTDP-4-dehydrorhamnose reductase
MKILVTGAYGQVGCELVRLGAESSLEIVAVDRDQLDITDAAAVENFTHYEVPKAVINAAAYTAVDQAEEEKDLAFAVNEHAVRYLARACAQLGIPLIHLSTDYVFDGKLERPYREEDAAAPLSVYGQSKWQGEQAIRQILTQHLILRLSAVFSIHGHNFVKTVVRLTRERQELRVVADQRTCPTAASDVANVIVLLVQRIMADPSSCWGTYHYRGAPPATWHQFATAILDITRQCVPVTVRKIIPITTSEYPTRAQRPPNSVLDCTKIQDVFNMRLRPWKDALSDVVHALCA